MTKIELARRIQTELMCAPKLLPAGHPAVERRARKLSKPTLEHQFALAVSAARSVGRTVIVEG